MNNEQLQQVLSACQYFFENTETENGRPISSWIYFEKGGHRRIPIVYAHENNNFFEKSHLRFSKGELVALQDRVEKKGFGCDLCSRKGQYKLTVCNYYEIVTFFYALLNKIPMGCLDAVIPEQLLRRSDVNCLVTNEYGEAYKD